jgi:hypothetical protein
MKHFGPEFRLIFKQLFERGGLGRLLYFGAIVSTSSSTKENSLMWNDFKAFIARGNVLDLAIAVILAAAFGKIVTTFTSAATSKPVRPPSRSTRL